MSGITVLQDNKSVLPLIQEIVDETALKIILSTIDEAKTTLQICDENKIPPSSTYRKIAKLQNNKLLSIEKINIDSRGKKVIFYRSKIKSIEFNLKKDGLLLQFNRNYH
jgi:preprotein translocase subunit SecA